jgi:hypothetical protein
MEEFHDQKSQAWNILEILCVLCVSVVNKFFVFGYFGGGKR